MSAPHAARLDWDKNTESDLAGYRIYKGLNPFTLPQLTDVGLTATPLTPGYLFDPVSPKGGSDAYATWYFQVTAYDTSNNEGPVSNQVSKLLYDDGPGGGFCG